MGEMQFRITVNDIVEGGTGDTLSMPSRGDGDDGISTVTCTRRHDSITANSFNNSDSS